MRSAKYYGRVYGVPVAISGGRGPTLGDRSTTWGLGAEASGVQGRKPPVGSRGEATCGGLGARPARKFCKKMLTIYLFSCISNKLQCKKVKTGYLYGRTVSLTATGGCRLFCSALPVRSA